MKTTLHLRAEHPEEERRAAALLRAGGLVAFATETVYGLGASALKTEAVAGIFQAKERPAWDPLIVHVASLEGAEELVQLDGVLRGRVEALAGAFWPGPLTMLLPRTEAVPDAITAGRPLVGVRVPGHPAALHLLREAGVPVAAPSANRFGHTSPTTAEHVLADLDGRIDAVLDAGPCPVGVESTVVDPGKEPMVVYRAGAVTAEMLQAAAGVRAELFRPVSPFGGARPEALPAPGVGLRHYAPAVPLVVTAGDAASLLLEVLSQRGRTGVLCPTGWQAPAEAVVWPWGRWDRPEELSSRMFAGLRALEASEVDVIVCPLPDRGGLRDALRDRLLKAAKK